MNSSSGQVDLSPDMQISIPLIALGSDRLIPSETAVCHPGRMGSWPQRNMAKPYFVYFLQLRAEPKPYDYNLPFSTHE